MPLVAVSYVAVTRATTGFTALTGQSLTSSSQDLAARIDTIYEHETKAALVLANNPVVQAAIAARARSGAAGAAAEIKAADAQRQ